MRKKIFQGNRQKNRIRTRVLLVCAVTSLMLTITGTLLVVLNMNSHNKTLASGTGTEGGGNDLNNGEIISEFTWENDPVTTATLGPDGISVSKEAHSMQGGRSSTGGLSPGSKGRNINLELQDNQIFKQDGIDISIDFRRNEPSGDFLTRGNIFNFGMDNGFITISYCTESKTGKTESVRAKTQYEIPSDPVFRSYRFIYTPTTGKAEIFVNSVIVWQHQHDKNTALSWKNGGNVIIGRNMNGGGVDCAIFDNLIVRSTGSVAPLAESLLNFMLESKDGGIKIHWSTSENEKVQNFTIERSINGVDFTNVTIVQARPDNSDDEYTFVDQTPVTSPLAYYRLRQTFKNGKFVTHPLSAIKFNSDKGFSIERVSPSPFQKTCDISYYLPKSGRVWMQITDEKGKILNTETFEAPKGKNVHVFKDEKNLQPGNYIFSLMFDNKKVTAKVTKS